MKAFALLCLMCVLATAQEPPRRPASTSTHQGNSPAAGTAATNTGPEAELQGLTADVARMKALLQQMQMNLAFVTSGQNPLKHQFELEVQMWTALIGSMERRIQLLQEQLGNSRPDATASPQHPE